MKLRIWRKQGCYSPQSRLWEIREQHRQPQKSEMVLISIEKNIDPNIRTMQLHWRITQKDY